MKNRAKNINTVIDYHDRTKHHPHRFAKSPGYMDWSTQPYPFRSYDGSDKFQLLLGDADPSANYDELFIKNDDDPKPLLFENISKFLELSLGLSAWKSFEGQTWSLRMNPSSGNLHAEEAYLILPPLEHCGGKAGVFHYDVFRHLLERRATIENDLWVKLTDGYGRAGFFLALGTIYWRESWKYGERAFRYCSLDSGHALACLAFSARLQGWSVTTVDSIDCNGLNRLLGFNQTDWRPGEQEEPELLIFVHAGRNNIAHCSISDDCIRLFEKLVFTGEPNKLSAGHYQWDIIDDVSAATRKIVSGDLRNSAHHDYSFKEETQSVHKASRIIRQRRSGQRYGAKSEISKETFLKILCRTLPKTNCAPFNIWPYSISVHLLIFVHRVSSLESGLYILFRNGNDIEDFQAKCGSEFAWDKVMEYPNSPPLYFLQKGDFTDESSMIICQQDIAGDGAFSLDMLANFRDTVYKDAHAYRRLYWEAGMIGQILYLEAEAHGLRGTGIGCYFDDMVHELLGFNDGSYQDIYHFTIGMPVEDDRLTTLPPYHHLTK